MRYREKAERFKKLIYNENRDSSSLKWKNKEELSLYLESFGGRIKEDKRRRKGHLVSVLQDSPPKLVAEVPMDFAMKVLVMGGFP